jgi:hypothetical protein
MLLLLLIRTLAAATASRCVGRAISKHASSCIIYYATNSRIQNRRSLCFGSLYGRLSFELRNDELNPQLAKAIIVALPRKSINPLITDGW